MNTRDYKSLREGEWYHIYNRGHDKKDTFIDAQDYRSFLRRLAYIFGHKEASYKTAIRPFSLGSFSLLSYCLMPNHFHFLIRQNSGGDIPLLMNKLGTSYAKYFNARHSKIGAVFQDTFKAKHVDNDSYLTYLSAYIHNNPAEPFDYPYSSLKEYTMHAWPSGLCDTGFLLRYFSGDKIAYENFVRGYSYAEHQSIAHLVFEETDEGNIHKVTLWM